MDRKNMTPGQNGQKPETKSKNKIAIIVVVVIVSIIGASVIGVLTVGTVVYFTLNNEKEDLNKDLGSTVVGKDESDPNEDLKEKEPSDDDDVTIGFSEYKEIEDAQYFSSASASSKLANQYGHNYDAANVLYDNEACWCEGAEGFGEGEWIKLELPSVQRLYGLEIKNGYAGTERQYSRNAKMQRVLLEFSDGQSMQKTLEVYPVEQRGNLQVIRFSQPIETRYVKITILSVVESECTDTCLTFVKPYRER